MKPRGLLEIDADRLHNASAEAATLGSMVIDHGVIPAVLELVDEDSFWLAEHKRMFAAIVQIWRKNPGGEVDGVLLRAQLENDDTLKDVGGLDYLRRVVESVVTSSTAVYYAQVVADRRRFRDLVARVEEMETCLRDGTDVDAQAESIQELALNLELVNHDKTVYRMGDAATQIAVDCQDCVNVTPTGLTAIDHYITGIAPSEMVVIGGRPSMGKTALASCITLNLGRSGKRVGFVTLEMSGPALVTRFLAILSKVSAKRVKNQVATKEELDRWYAASLELKDLPITIVEGLDTPAKQIAFVRRERKAVGLDVLVVDYLGLMRSGRRTANRNEEMSEISRSLKVLAQEAHIPVIALSQLNRQVTARESHKPRLSDLRDSGSIEQDADVVMLVHREDFYRQQRDCNAELDGLAEVLIAKARDAATGTCELVFIAEATLFADLAPAWKPKDSEVPS